MQIVKVSQPTEWENKINLVTPREEGVWGDYKFILTNSKIDCDFWIVLGDLNSTQEAVCPEENVIYITDEAHTEKQYDQRFLKQFSSVITSREDVIHHKLITAPYICSWFLKKNYDFLKALKFSAADKTNVISAVSSNLTWLEGHKNRFAFINQMMGHFKKRLDVYGRGFNEVDDKYDALINYRYSIAIENSHLPRYFSDKIVDCFLTWTMPVYYGCTDILEYFPEESMLLIDVKNYQDSINKIEEAISSNRFVRNFDYLAEARNVYFARFHPLQIITNLLEQHFEKKENKKKVILKSMKEATLEKPASQLYHSYRTYIKRFVS